MNEPLLIPWGGNFMARRLPVAALLCLAALAPAADPSRLDAVDRAVRQALVFLQRAQEAVGGWRALGSTRTAGVSGLCTMAFLSAGHTPTEGPFAKNVADGVRFALSRQQSN